jgi:hypothetical protein
MNNLSRFILIAALLASAFLQTPNTYSPQTAVTINLANNLQTLGYSPDHNLLIALQTGVTDGTFYLYSGKTLRSYIGTPYHIVDTQMVGNITPYSWAFSANSNSFAIGTTQGCVYGFSIDGTGVVTQNTTQRFCTGVDSTVKSISISAKGQIAITVKTNLIVLNTDFV